MNRRRRRRKRVCTPLADVSFRCLSIRRFGLGALSTRGYGCGKLASLLGIAIEPVISGHRGQPDIFATIHVVLEG